MANVVIEAVTPDRRKWSRRARLTGIFGATATALGLIFRVLVRIYGDPYLAGMTMMLIYVTVASLLSPKDNRAGYR